MGVLVDQLLSHVTGGRMTGNRKGNGSPLVTLSYAQSLDGSLATRRGAQTALSSPESLVLTHELRAAHDAILVGIGSVIADNPRLTVRKAPGEDPQPIILDSHLRFPLDRGLLKNPKPPWIIGTTESNPDNRKKLEQVGAKVFTLSSSSEGRVDLLALLSFLGNQGIKSIMVEGGASVITSFLSQRLVDQIVATIVPIFIGGLRVLEGLLVENDLIEYHSPNSILHQFPRLQQMNVAQLGSDLIVWGAIV